MSTFDASSIIYAWDNYPIDQFPPLWEWMAKEFQSGAFSIPKVAFGEVAKKIPECANWLSSNGATQIPVTQAVLDEAVRIKALLGITNDKYHGDGVGENDILIIATASVHRLQLVSNESSQKTLPANKAKMKIPAVCGMGSVPVQCVDYLELLKHSGEVFGG